MVHASLFTGIGGFDLAAEWCGWENSFQCEIDPFCQKVLAKNFPHADRHTDIKGFDARRYRGTVDVLSGGFPCQPFSLAGQRKGNSDDRALWPQMLRVIDEVRPRWIIGENVAGLASLGLDGVLFDLEASGYACETVLLPACSIGAPHRRDRLWILAHANGLPAQRFGGPDYVAGTAGASEADGAEWQRNGAAPGYCGEAAAHAPDNRHNSGPQHDNDGIRPLRTGKCSGHDALWGEPSRRGEATANPYGLLPHRSWEEGHRRPEPTNGGGLTQFRLTEPPLCGANDGLPAGLVRVSTRAKQLKAYGNSIVPQVAFEIFRAIQLTNQ